MTDSTDKNEKNQAKLLAVFVWVNLLTQIGAVICCGWVIYRVYELQGFGEAFLAFFGLSIIYKFGTAPMFAVAASILCFYFKAVSIWLPIISYILAVVLLLPVAGIGLGSTHRSNAK